MVGISLRGDDRRLWHQAGKGALINNGTPGGAGNRQPAANITLSDNATIGGTGSIYMINGGYAADTLDLAGFTLTKTGEQYLLPPAIPR